MNLLNCNLFLPSGIEIYGDNDVILKHLLCAVRAAENIPMHYLLYDGLSILTSDYSELVGLAYVFGESLPEFLQEEDIKLLRVKGGISFMYDKVKSLDATKGFAQTMFTPNLKRFLKKKQIKSEHNLATHVSAEEAFDRILKRVQIKGITENLQRVKHVVLDTSAEIEPYKDLSHIVEAALKDLENWVTLRMKKSSRETFDADFISWARKELRIKKRGFLFPSHPQNLPENFPPLSTLLMNQVMCNVQFAMISEMPVDDIVTAYDEALCIKLAYVYGDNRYIEEKLEKREAALKGLEFEHLLQVVRIPNLSEILREDAGNFEYVQRVKHSKSGKEFRKWFHKAFSEEPEQITKAYVDAISDSLNVSQLPKKIMRYLIITLPSLIPVVGTVASAVIGAADMFLIDKLGQGHKLKAFVDDLKGINLP